MIDARSTATEDRAPRVRDRQATEERILATVGQVLARDGFAGIGVNAIAREAGIDKVLIYRYFGGLPKLLRTWGASGRFWPSVSDLLRADLLQHRAGQRSAFLLHDGRAGVDDVPVELDACCVEDSARDLGDLGTDPVPTNQNYGMSHRATPDLRASPTGEKPGSLAAH